MRKRNRNIEMTFWVSDEEKEIELIKIWSTVQGIASIACMENVTTSKPWETYLDKLIN